MRAWRLEQLENRTLLNGTPITSPQAQAILEGSLALADLGTKFDSQAALVVQPLDLLVQPAGQVGQPTTPVSLSTLVPFDTLANSLHTSILNYFQLNNTPTYEDLEARLEADFRASADNITLTLGTNLITYAFTNLHETGEAHLGLDLGGGQQPENLAAASTAAPVDITMNLDMPLFTFNIEPGSAQFFFNTPQVEYTVASVALPGTFEINAGFLGATVQGGSISPITGSTPTVSFRDPLGIGQITTQEIESYLNGTSGFRPFDDGSGGFGMNVQLPLQTSLGAFSTSAGLLPTVAIIDTNLLDATPPSFQTTNYDTIRPFNVIAPQQVIDLFNQVSLAVDKLAGSSVLDAPIPFTSDQTIGNDLHLGDLIRSTLVRNLTKTVNNPDGVAVSVPTFATAQDLVDQLATILHVNPASINPVYDPNSGDLLFTVSLTTQNPLQTIPFVLNRQDLGVQFSSSAASLALNENGVLTFTFGVNLLGTSTPKLSTSSPAQGLNGPVIPLDGKLQADAAFTLTDDQNHSVKVTVTKASTANNNTPLDLVDDFNTALQAAGLNSVVAGLATLNPTMVGTGTFPGDGRLRADSHFTLTIDSNAPVSITVSQSATANNNLTSELVGDYNAALQAAGITSVVASIAPPSQEIDGSEALPNDGRLSSDATFTLTIDQAAPVKVTVKQVSASRDSSPSDLVNAVNDALRTAGLSNIMASLTSRVVEGVGQTTLMLYAVQANQFRTITLNTSPTDPAATVLGFSNGQVGRNQPTLRFAGVAANPIHLLTLTTSASDPLVTQFGFSPSQSEGFVSARLTLTQNSPTGRFLRFNAAADDPSITQLGFGDGQVGRSSANVTFVQGMSYTGTMSLTTSSDAAIPSGTYGFLGTNGKALTASSSANINIQVKDPNGGALGGRVSLSDLKSLTNTITTTANLTAGSETIQITGDTTGLAKGQGVAGPGIAPDTIVTGLTGKVLTLSKAATQAGDRQSITFSQAPSLVKSPTTTGSGAATLKLSVPSLGLDSQTYALNTSVGDIDNPFTSLALDTSGMGNLQNYQYLTFKAVVNSLQLTTNYLADTASFHDGRGQSALTASLPVIGKSFVDLIDYARSFQEYTALMLASPRSTLQDYVKQANTFLANFGIQASVTPTFSGQGTTTTLGLEYKVTLTNSFNGGLPLNVEGIPTLLSLATGTSPSDAANLAGITQLTDVSGLRSTQMPTTSSASFVLPVGLDLENPKDPKPFLFDSNSLATLSLNVSAPNLEGVPVSLGRIGLFVDGGAAYVNGNGVTPASNATATIALDNATSSRNYFDDTLYNNSRVSIAGKAGVSLPISLTPTGGAGTLKPPLTLAVTSLADLLDGISGSVAPIQAPSISGYDQLIKMIQNTTNLTSGINKYLLDFQNLLNTQVLNLSYPIVGTQLQNVGQIFDQFRVGLSFQVGQDAYTNDPIAVIQNTMFLIFGSPQNGAPLGLGWLVDQNGQPGTPQDIVVQTDGSSFVNWSAHLREALTLTKETIGFDTGLPGLQMSFPTKAGSTQNTVDLKFGFDQVFNFGIDVKNGFNVETPPNQPLTISFDATPHVDPTTGKAQPLSGTFGYFGIDATPDLNRPLYPGKTGFTGAFTVNVNGGVSVPGKLVYQDLLLDEFTITPKLAATSNTNLGLKTHYLNTSFSLQILSDYEMQWNFSTSDPDLRGSQPLAGFYGIGTNWSDAVGHFLGPGFKSFVDKLNSDPIGPILDFLGRPLPVISYLLGPTDIVQFLGDISGQPAAGQAFNDFLGVIDLFRGLYAAVPTGGYKSEYNLTIDQGDMVITQDLRGVKTLSEIVSYVTPRDPSLAPFVDQVDAYESDPKNKEFTTDEDGGIISGALLKSLNIGLTNASISLPFFSDPKFVKSMLLGGTGDLFRLVTPSVAFTVQAEIDFPPIPIGPIPLVIHAGGYIQPSIQFGYGFDTRGFQLASAGMGDDVAAESSYFIVSKSVLDIPLKLYFGAGTGIPDVLTLSLDLYFLWDNQIGFVPINGDSPNPDTRDKFYIDQFSAGSGFFHDLRLSGSLQVGAQLDLGILIFHKYINIWNPQTLFSYSTAASEPQLANVGEEGVLRLNVGSYASSRGVGDMSDGDESITIRHVGGTAGNEDLEVSGFGVAQVYHGVTKIVGNFGQGNNSINVASGVLANAELTGGDGHNSLIYQGQGSAILRGGRGDDDLEALGPGSAQIYAGGGNDTLKSGSGKTTFWVSGGGNDAIDGGTGDSTLQVSGGLTFSLSNTSLGIDGFTSTLTNVRHAVLVGDDRDNMFTVSNWSGDAVIDAVNGFDQTTVNLGGGGSVTIARSGSIGRDSITINNDDRGGAIQIMPTQISRGAEVVRYSTKIESLTINAGAGDTTLNLLGNAEGLTAINGGSGTTTLDVYGTRDFTQTTFHGGLGNSIVHVGLGLTPATLAGQAIMPAGINGGLVLTGGLGQNLLDVDLAGDLSNLLLIRGFNQGSMIEVHGNLDHALVADAKSLSSVEVTGSLSASGVIRAGGVDHIGLGGDLVGLVDISGPIHAMSVGGSLLGTTLGTSLGTLAIGGDLAGTVNVAGPIGGVSVSGATSGTIIANDVGVVTARAATGPTVLNIIEAGVSRRIDVAPVVPGDPNAAAIRFAYIYDSTGPGAPEVALRVANPTMASFDLALTTGSASEFNLARLDAIGRAGLRNLAIDGDLLDRVTPSEATFFGLPARAVGGVNLPKDHLGVIAVRGDVRIGSIQAAGVQGLAFSSLTGPHGQSLPASRVDGKLAAKALRKGTRLVAAHGTFHVPVLERHPVTLFFKSRRGQPFDSRPVSLRDTVQDGKSNTATVSVKVTRSGSRIQSIRFTGPGGVYRTRQPVGTSPHSVATGHTLSPRLVDAVLAKHPRIHRKQSFHYFHMTSHVN